MKKQKPSRGRRKIEKKSPGIETPFSSPTAKRYTQEERDRVLTLVAEGMTRVDAAARIGASTQSLRNWINEAERKGTMPVRASSVVAPAVSHSEVEPVPAGSRPTAKAPISRSPYSPRDPGNGLSDPEVAAILELKKQHPSMGPAQLRAQLKRFKGWRISLKAIARVLRQNGYELVHRGSRPKGPEPTRFEAPRRNALWQADYAEVRVHDERLHVLFILDDFSRFIVGHALADGPTSAVATETIKAAIARHGKPEAIRTDRGGAFTAYTKETDFGRFLERELIDHIVGRSYHPQGGGKVEAGIKTLRRELWDIGEFADRREAAGRLAAFVEEYNHRRAHMGIDGLTPADRFFGRADRVLKAIDAISRKRQGALEMRSAIGRPMEETFGPEDGAPTEVLRLVIIDGILELRFCGARIVLGPVEI